jgi:methylthioribose-1-phosphate isomerase
VQLVHELLRYNTLAVDFWLAACILPRETRQFPQGLKITAWHLTHRDATSKVLIVPALDSVI